MISSYYKPLTGLRFIAALMVFIHHFTPWWLPWRVYDVLQEWHVGVTIFFTLSGFLICTRYYDSFALDKTWFKKYIVNRIARIYPMYFILTTFTFLVLQHNWKLYLLNITFLRGFFDDFLFQGINQGWSQTVEETFYVAAPFIFYISRKHWLWLQPAALIVTGTVLTVYFNDIHTLHGFFGSYRLTFLFTFFGRCFEFFAGIQLALWIRQQKSFKKFALPYTYIGGAAIIFLTVVLSLQRGNERYGLYQNSGIVINNAILPVFICMLIYGLITEKTIFSRLLSTQALQLLGKSSYCFYLIHLGIAHTFYRFTFGNGFFGELIFMTLLSIVLFKLMEEPLQKLVKKTLT